MNYSLEGSLLWGRLLFCQLSKPCYKCPTPETSTGLVRGEAAAWPNCPASLISVSSFGFSFTSFLLLAVVFPCLSCTIWSNLTILLQEEGGEPWRVKAGDVGCVSPSHSVFLPFIPSHTRLYWTPSWKSKEGKDGARPGSRDGVVRFGSQEGACSASSVFGSNPSCRHRSAPTWL